MYICIFPEPFKLLKIKLVEGQKTKQTNKPTLTPLLDSRVLCVNQKET